MDIALSRRLSFKQASLTVLVAFVLGILVSLLQISIDYANEDAAINREINALLEISRTPTTRILYNIDAELAHELALGLLNSPAIVRVEIIDNAGSSLASVSRERLESRYRPISDFLFGSERQFNLPLFARQGDQDALGQLSLNVDTYAFGGQFLRRALLTLTTGFISSLLLAMILLILFYFMLTKPLVSLISAISSRAPDAPARQQLSCPPGHEEDEIGVLVRVTNQQISSIAAQIDRRREAEERLKQYLSELESIISTRTSELSASNERLTLSNQALEISRSNALQTAQARAAFLASMSHEIRTPLNGLLGMLDLARDGPLSSEQTQQLKIASDSGNVLLALLNDILDMSKIEAGQLLLEQLPFDLAAIAEETASLLSENTESTVELSCLIDPDIPERVLGDPTRVRQIISNLLSNALKFTHQGRVDLRITSTADGVRISVHDTGIGIPASQQNSIFQPFTQAEAGTTRQYGGTGLGLALTRTLCEAMHGHLSLSSTEGVGSQFTVELPLPTVIPANPATPLRGQIASLVIANSGLAEQLHTLLPHWGLSHKAVSEPTELALLQPALLISDASAPLPALRQQYPQLPLILIDSYGNFLDTEQKAALAPLTQLARPLTRKQLYQAIAEILQTSTASDTDVQPIAASSEKLNSATILLVEDNPVNQLVAKSMLNKLGCTVLIANQGQEALDCLAQHPVDLVLMDCSMPVMDGYEASRRIRQNPDWQSLPIIALTANALADERERCLAAGMSDYLAKPYRRDDLSALLEHWLAPKA